MTACCGPSSWYLASVSLHTSFGRPTHEAEHHQSDRVRGGDLHHYLVPAAAYSRVETAFRARYFAGDVQYLLVRHGAMAGVRNPGAFPACSAGQRSHLCALGDD